MPPQPRICPRRPVPSRALMAAFAHPSSADTRASPYTRSLAYQTQSGLSAIISFFTEIGNSIVLSDSAKYLISGATAGIVSRTVVSPFEVIATLNMCSVDTVKAKGPIAQLLALFKAEGVRGFFKGNFANCLKVAPTKGIQFLTFEGFKRLISGARGEHERDKPLSPAERLTAGGIAGIVAGCLCYPLDVAKTLLTAYPETYKGIFNTLSTVVKQKGVRGLYRGLGPTLVAMFPYVGLELMVYEQLSIFYTRTNENKEPSIPIMMLLGAFAGSLAQTTCHPLDVVRKRLQLQGTGGRPLVYKTMIDAFRGIAKKEGVGALYRGLIPTYMSVIPSAAVTYVVYEGTKRLLNVQSLK
mmetsp:Transcript_10103/g.25312  ORF Transcript_10103/g.25312 Transcript_10103/m.25312 type:complete len:355 (-) Transcript_10103:213-1277(-)